MSEEEYEEYLKQVFGLHEYEHEHEPLQERLMDENHYFVPGCYHTRPAQSE